jgi:hypothetical protein
MPVSREKDNTSDDTTQHIKVNYPAQPWNLIEEKHEWKKFRQ